MKVFSYKKFYDDGIDKSNSMTKVKTPVFIVLSNTLVNDFLKIKQQKRINGVGV